MTTALRYYHLETFLFEDVSVRYQAGEALRPVDFFAIVIWKSNRAKSKIAKRLLAQAPTLDEAVTALVTQIRNADGHRRRLEVLMTTWGFSIPMASAILTVFYPDDFTIYDYRATEALKSHADLANISRFDQLWPKYEAFLAAVRATGTESMSLRDKDRTLWGQAFYDQLVQDIDQNFARDK
jgi:hypothetical protein